MPPTRFVIRAYHRVPIRCGLYYMGEEFLGKGTVMDLSPKGFRVLGDCGVLPGVELVVRLSLPDGGGAVDIQQVIVRWVRGLWFGVKVVKLHAEAEARMNTWLAARRGLLFPSYRQ